MMGFKRFRRYAFTDVVKYIFYIVIYAVLTAAGFLLRGISALGRHFKKLFTNRKTKVVSLSSLAVLAIIAGVLIFRAISGNPGVLNTAGNTDTRNVGVSPEQKETTGSAVSPDAPKATGPYNYGEALQKSIMFYEFQRSGKLDPSKIRNNWRGDSGLNDGKDAGIDLTGGWYDAGDNVKFNLPMSYSAAMLGWSVYEYKDAYVKSGQLPYILDNIKWATDYLIKCHPSPDVFYYQVGDGNKDHAWWGPAEAMHMERPSYKLDKSNPGSAVTGEASAALAVASIIFKDTDKEYSAKCLKHSKELYEFSESTKSDAGYKAADAFYKSWSGFYDELSWAGAWLYIATKDDSYLKKAEEYSKKWGVEAQTTNYVYKWTQSWDDVHYGAQLLLARLDKDKKEYKESMERCLDYWTDGYNGQKIKYTPKGLAFLDTWGSLRYSTTTAFLAFVYSDWDGCDRKKADVYSKFGEQQMDYALGSSGRSFVVGFGENPPQHPHHRTSQGSGTDNMSNPEKSRHVLYGALVGGPGADDSYDDKISDYTKNEVACDYNAGFTGALCRMYLKHGGNPIPDFKAIEEKQDEFFVEAGINASGSNFTEIKAVINNTSGWPARSSSNLSFRYFMDIGNSNPEGYKVTLNYNQGGAKISGLKKFKDNCYYVTVDFSGTDIYPGGQSQYKKEVQFRITAPDGVNFEKDYSYNGLSKGSVTKTKYIPVYDSKVKVAGLEPGESPGAESSSVKTYEPVTDKTVKASSNAAPAAPSASSTSSSGDIKVLSYNTSTTADTNNISAKLRAVNQSNSSLDLSRVKLRYYFNSGNKKINFYCDWASCGNTNVTGNFVKMNAKSGADGYLEISFTSGAGSLNAGNYVELQIRFAHDDWSSFNQKDHYSFNPSANDYADYPRITAFIEGRKVYGSEP